MEVGDTDDVETVAPGAVEFPSDLAALTVCPGGCGAYLSLPPDAFVQYFAGKDPLCTTARCSLKSTCLKLAAGVVNEHLRRIGAYGLFGARNIRIRLKIKRDRTIKLDLAAVGLPEAARILQVIYTTESSDTGKALTPTELHSNVPIRDPTSHRPFLYGITHGKACEPETQITVLITFIDLAHAQPQRHLFQAVRSFEANRYEDVVMPANIAVDSALTPVLKLGLRRFAGSERLDDFLTDAATYAYQLDIISSLIAQARISSALRSGDGCSPEPVA